MSDFVSKLVKPTVEFIDHIAAKVPQALAKGHHRISQYVHKAADDFDKAEDDLAGKAGSLDRHEPGAHRDPEDVAGVGSSAASRAASGERSASDAARDAEHTADGEHPGEPGGLRSGADGRGAIPGDEKHCETDPVDVVTGEMLMPAVDVRLPGALELVLERTHLSSYRHGTWFGPTWASTLDQRLQLDADGVVFASADGMLLAYPPPGPDRPVLPVRGPRMPLAWSGVPGDPMRVTDPRTGRTLVFGDPRPAPGVPGGVILRLTGVEDRNDRRIDITWAPDDTPALISHHGGYRIAVDRHPTLPRVTGFRLLDTDGPGTETVLARFGHDDAGDLTEIVNSSGLPVRLAYDDRHRVTAWTDRNGTRYAYAYDEAGRVVRTEGSEGRMAGTFAYEDRTTRFTDSLGATTTYEYNDAHRLVRTTDPLGNVTVREWDEANRATTAITDALGRTTRFTHDAAGDLTAVTHPDGSRAEVAYNAMHLPVAVTDAGGGVWRTEYDERGNRTASVDPTGARAEFVRDAHGCLVAATDPLGARYEVAHDAAGLPVALTDALGRRTTARRDAFGRVVEATDALGQVVRFGWTVEGQVTWCERADGRRETWEHDAEGNVVAHTDSAGHTTAYAASHFDVPSSTTGPDGVTYAFGHDTELRLTDVTNPDGQVWRYAYDARGLLVRESDFSGRVLEYAYDAVGDLVSRTDSAGATITFSRDALGRLVEHRHGDEWTTYAYDAAGNLCRSATAHAEVAREFDALGRVTAETVNGRTMRYAYDALGRPVERRTPSGVVSTWSYDAVGFPREMDLAGNATAFTLDGLGRETARSFGSGVTVEQTWDRTGRLTGQVLSAGGADARRVVQQREFAYRADDLLTEIRELTGASREFGLDRAGRVTAVRARGWTESYAYDALGNLTGATTPLEPAGEAPDAPQEGATTRRFGRTRYTYDARGRVVRAAKRLLDGRTRTRTYTWNALDQLVETVTERGERWRYAYDPWGRRTAKQRLDADGTVLERTEFAWSGSVLAERTGADGATTTWEYKPGTHRPVAQLDRHPGEADTDARFHAIVTDLVGTPTELVTPDGEIAWQRRTTLWGVPVTDPSSETVECPLRFPGQYADDETGWNYNHFRHYDPHTAQYTSQDPLGLGPAPNPSAYVDNPYASADPFGLKASWEPADITWGGRVAYGALDSRRGNRATGVEAVIHKDMLGGHTDAQPDPAGWGDTGAGWDPDKKYNRGHLLGSLLGGSNEDPRNFATMHEFANSPVMRHYELQIQQAVKNGHVVHYKVTPVYASDKDVIPVGLTLEARSSDGFTFKGYSRDTKTRRALRAGEGTNSVTIMNIPKDCSG
ncbi:DNA/RNA non-specific endonuclease [Streptomyces sp. PTM05]|uniref:DNA/RNA non-specific endonuclease n=1 Tax=Streptantibioticus parmotrematis TaxID=2873249 RepID=A0ABS7QUU5_9ACTN|nr:DUF6531 domain-containing protein [Streptantibioticus parmotrematis]MBY8886683.1 DNA/RNA non-specific endonuclease [Streptantibioticus parmotrematis]